MRPIEGQFLTFSLQEQLYGIPVASVKEINQILEITEVPKSPAFMRGVINLRGKVIPVIDLRLKLDIPPIDFSKQTCIIVIESEVGEIGAIVDAVRSVVSFSHNQIQPPPDFGKSSDTSFIMGLGKSDQDIVILVDIVSCFSRLNISNIISLPDTSIQNDDQFKEKGDLFDEQSA